MLAPGAGGLPVPRHLLRGGALPLRAGDRASSRSSRATYYWMPKWTGHMYSESWARCISGSRDLGQRAVLPAALPRLAGMPRRIPDYNVAFANFNMISSIGGFRSGPRSCSSLFCICKSIRGGRQGDRPNRGKKRARRHRVDASFTERRFTPSPPRRTSNERDHHTAALRRRASAPAISGPQQCAGAHGGGARFLSGLHRAAGDSQPSLMDRKLANR